MPESFGEKSHEASPLKRQRAREEGQVAKSQDLASAILLVVAALVVAYSGRGLADFLGRYARRQLGGASLLGTDPNTALAEFQFATIEVAKAVVPLFLLLLVVAIMTQIAQVGLLFVPRKLAMDLSRVDPIRGLQRLFSLPTFVRFSFGIFKVGVVTAVALWSLWLDREMLLGLSGLAVGELIQTIFSITFWTTIKIAAALLLLAILDFLFQRWKHEQDLRMTTQEMREELKSLQGDPHIMARRKQVQRQLYMNRLGSVVPQANVVVTNPTELSVAIQYNPETMAAPIVVAKGAGVLAKRIRGLARAANIPIVERKTLARALYKQVEPGHPIPTAQFAAVAEVLRYVYQLQGKTIPGADRAA